ncbi:GIY-YIG nuclease family protein [Arthrobacter sp. R3-55]
MLEVERLAATGITQEAIAAQVGVHRSTVADDLSILRGRKSKLDRARARVAPESVVNQAPFRPTPPVAPSPQTPSDRTWSERLPCDTAWASTRNEKGVYRWFLAGALPESSDWPDHLTPIAQGSLIYVGKATNLRTRAKHHKLQTSSSTLRRTLSSLMGFPAVWHGSSAHPRIREVHHALLTRWMTGNLLMSYSPLRDGEVLSSVEDALRRESKAPLNKDGMTAEQLYASQIGIKWKAAAGPRP